MLSGHGYTDSTAEVVEPGGPLQDVLDRIGRRLNVPGSPRRCPASASCARTAGTRTDERRNTTLRESGLPCMINGHAAVDAWLPSPDTHGSIETGDDEVPACRISGEKLTNDGARCTNSQR